MSNKYRGSFFVFICLICMLIGSGLWAQEDDQEGEGELVFAPFVSGLRIAKKEGEIKLSWRDIQGIEGGYIVYRHTSEITFDNIEQAEIIARLDENQETYIDTPEESGSYYYAVLAEDQEGLVYEVLVPFRNKTIQGVDVKVVSPIDERATLISDIRAKKDSKSITIEFSSSRTGREVVVFRNTAPIESPEDLALSSTVDTVPSERGKVTDYPVPGVPYYYAAIDSERITEEVPIFSLGVNATVEPVELPLGTKRSAFEALERQDLRPLPLPYLSGKTNENGGADPLGGFVQAQALEPATSKAVAAVLKLTDSPSHPLKSAVILGEDRVADRKGEEYTLQTIVEGPFSYQKWEESREQLSNFLSFPRSTEVRARAYFYRGQAYYFLKEYRKAFMDFLFAQEEYPKQTDSWIDEVLFRLSSN